MWAGQNSQPNFHFQKDTGTNVQALRALKNNTAVSSSQCGFVKKKSCQTDNDRLIDHVAVEETVNVRCCSFTSVKALTLFPMLFS